jgi:hypothetical protein
MDAACSSEMSLTVYQSAWHHIPEHMNLHQYHCENFKSHMTFLTLCCQFDVARWLVIRRPRLSERSQFIELVGKALAAAGLNPAEDKLMLHEVCVLNVL